MKRTDAWLLLLLSTCSSCEGQASKNSRSRSEAISSASVEMSGPSLFSSDVLQPALDALQARAGGKFLRLEIGAHELVAQVADPSAPSGVSELHYRDGKVSEPEFATVRGKGQLADNLFDLGDVQLGAISTLAREAVRRIDPEAGRVDYILVRRNLPASDEVRLRIYVQSPQKSGHIDADHTGTPL